jgi:prolyl-tRNA synthetase
LPTLREEPKDAEAVSHKLMVRAGLIRRLGAGAYSYLPFGLRALQKAAAIIREELNAAGAQELLLPALQPIELWQATGRDAALGEVLIRFTDRTGKEMVLGPTHEEVITDLLKEVRSYKQLPLILYQIQTKFRDEPRPRFGVIRSKEFLMMDAYSFDVDEEGLRRSYQAMSQAYERIFRRAGLKVLACDADPGVMGGDVSHEFMAPADSGEDRVVRCPACGYAANLEAARCGPIPDTGQPTAHSRQEAAEEPKPLERVATPGRHTVAQVSAFLKVPASRLIKTLLYDVGDQEQIGVLVRGDHDVNEAKLIRAVGSPRVRLSSAQTIERLSGAPVGFAGPVGLSGVRLLADAAAMRVVNGVAGANQDQMHLINVNPDRDVQVSAVADLRMAADGDACPVCGKALEFLRAIEVGHVFKLGTKYSQTLGAVIQDAAGAIRPMVMGCYGIGVNRILAACIEQRHDQHGLIWPPALAPFHVLVMVLKPDHAEHVRVGQEVHDALAAAGLEVLLDDRQQSAGSKLKDADLIGIPLQIIIGKRWQQDGRLEMGLRATQQRSPVSREEVVEVAHKLLDSVSHLT